MEYPKEQIDELKKYCSSVSAMAEAGVTYLLLEGLRLPAGCKPPVCNALLRPVPGDGYPSRLFFSEMITSSYTRNWNVNNARIGEKNWVAFSWTVNLVTPTLAQILVAHMTGFVKEK